MTLVLVGIVTAEGVGKQLYPERIAFAEVARFLVQLGARKRLEIA